MKKRILTLALVALLVMSIAGPALAAITTPGSRDTTMTYGVAQAFTVTIPADFTLSTAETVKTVSATGVLLPNGKQLTVTMGSAEFDATDKYRVAYEGSYIKYTVKVGDSALDANNQTVLTVTAGSTNGSADLKFQTTTADIAAATKAGDHTDTLTFTVAVGDAA